MWSEKGIINLLRSLLNFRNLGLMSCSKSADHLVSDQTVVQTDISFEKSMNKQNNLIDKPALREMV